MKKCARCKIEKNQSEFGKRKSRPDGLYNYCKSCKSEDDKKYRNKPEIKLKAQIYQQNYYKENKQKLDKININYYYNNKDSIKTSRKIYNSKDEIKVQRNLNQKKRKETDILYKLACNLRSRTSTIFANTKRYKDKTFIQYIGCTTEFLKIYLESKFKIGMTWDNYGEFWHIDHIDALGLAQTSEEIYKLAHYTNLQPLDTKEHFKKTINDNKLIKELKYGKQHSS